MESQTIGDLSSKTVRTPLTVGRMAVNAELTNHSIQRVLADVTSVLADRPTVNQGRFVHEPAFASACELAINGDRGLQARLLL